VGTGTVGEVCLEGQGTSAASSSATSRCRCRRSHLAVQGEVENIIARGDLLALGTSTTRDNGHIAISRLAATTPL
jgi:hypothetical protein